MIVFPMEYSRRLNHLDQVCLGTALVVLQPKRLAALGRRVLLEPYTAQVAADFGKSRLTDVKSCSFQCL